MSFMDPLKFCLAAPTMSNLTMVTVRKRRLIRERRMLPDTIVLAGMTNNRGIVQTFDTGTCDEAAFWNAVTTNAAVSPAQRVDLQTHWKAFVTRQFAPPVTGEVFLVLTDDKASVKQLMFVNIDDAAEPGNQSAWVVDWNRTTQHFG